METVWRTTRNFKPGFCLYRTTSAPSSPASKKPSALDLYQAPATTPTKRGGVNRSIIDSPSGATSSFLFCLLI